MGHKEIIISIIFTEQSPFLTMELGESCGFQLLGIPVGDILDVGQGVFDVALLGAQNDAVEIGVNDQGAEALEFGHQPGGEAGGKEQSPV